MRYNGSVEGTQAVRPANMERNGNSVYIRGNISRKMHRDEGMGETRESWIYDEVVMTLSEYDVFSHLGDVVPTGQWTAGLQEAGRSVRYQRMDGHRAKCERNIRLGIDPDVYEERLRIIDEYCEAVRQTQYAEGYPTADPVWPEEPEF